MGDSTAMDLFADKLGRRDVLIGGIAVAALLAMPSIAHGAPMMAPMAGTPSVAQVRSLLRQASRTAFADLSKPDGFWTSSVARIGVPTLFANNGRAPNGRAIPRQELQHRLNTIAQAVLPRASGVIDQGIMRLGTVRALPVLGSEPTAATTVLRRTMGPRLINAMIPVLARALRQHNDPVIRQAMLGLKGVSVNDVAHALANETDNGIWYAVGAGEAEVRRRAVPA